MRILFLHEVNYLTKPIFEMHEFPEHLVRRGHDVAFFHFPEGMSVADVREIGWKSQIKGRVLHSSRITLFTPQISPGTTLGRAIHFIFSYFLISRAIREFAPDVVVSYSFPTSGLQGLLASRRAKVQYISRVIDVSHKIRRFPFPGIIKLLEKNIYSNSDWLSANNTALLEYCQALSLRKNSCSVDLPPLDLSHFSSKKKSTDQIQNKIGVPRNAKIIMYMGSFFYFSGLEELIQSFASSRKPDEYLVLVGGGDQDKELRLLVEGLNLKGIVIFTGFVDFSELPSYIAISTVTINPMVRATVSDLAFPNKVIQYMASAKPVSTTRLKSLESIFLETPALLFGETPTEVLANAYRLARSRRPAYLGMQNKKVISDIFDLKRQVMNFENLLENVVKYK